MAMVGVGVAPVGVGFGGATPPKERDSGVPSGGSGGTPGDRHWSGMQAGCPGIPRRPGSAARAGWHPFRPQRYRRAVGPGHIEPQAGFAADLPRRASAVRGFSGSGRAYRRQKSVPGRAPRWKLTSEPGYHPHRLRYGTEIPLTRDLLRGAGSPPLPDRHHPPRKSVLLGEAFGFASTGPENLRPSTRHRDLHRPSHTDINKTAKQ